MITLEFSASTPSIARASALAAGMRVAADYAANNNKKMTSAIFFDTYARVRKNPPQSIWRRRPTPHSVGHPPRTVAPCVGVVQSVWALYPK